ncbi:MAG: PASTA domain-containing protein, partial [Rikenellaceae bacterium]
AGEVLDQLPRGGVEVKPGRSVYIVINAFNAKRAEVPYVAGRSLRQAKNMLEVAGFEIKRIEYRSDMATNYVLDEYLGTTQITSSTKLMEAVGSGVTLHVGRSADNLTTAVPLVVGLTEREAKGRLWEAGLNVGTVSKEEGIDASNIAEARVYAQSRESQSQSLLGADVSFSLTLDEGRVEQVLEELRKAQQEREKYEKYLKDSLAQVKVERASTPKSTVKVEDDFNFFE